MSYLSGKSVFVAETSENMRSYKQNIIKELEHQGCEINTFFNPSQSFDTYAEKIKNCDVAIHILSNVDEISENEDIGFEEIQVNFSIQHYNNLKLSANPSETKFKIFAWHPKLNAHNIYEEENVAPQIQNIQNRAEVELLRTPFEEFKNYLFKKIDPSHEEQREKELINEKAKGLSIYLIYDIKDIEAAEEYIGYIQKLGLKVYSPIFSTNVIEVRQQHNICLKKCDINIIFSTADNINWANMKIMDILKSLGLGRKNPILGNAVIMPLEAQNKIPLLSRGFEFIAYENNSSNIQIAQFLKKHQ